MSASVTPKYLLEGAVYALEQCGMLLRDANSLYRSASYATAVALTAIYNLQGEHLGSVYNLMVDKISGQVAYAVMSFGGFLGMGESYHPLPWRVLKYDVRQNGYVVDLDQRRLDGAPSYTASNLPNWSDRTYGHRVDDYYGVPPYGF
jgi:hypothetical protein